MEVRKKKYKGFPFKINPDQIFKRNLNNFCSRSDQFTRGFLCEFEGDLNFLVNFFFGPFQF